MRLVAEQSEDDYVHGGTQKDEYGPEDVVSVPCPLCAATSHDRLYTEQGEIGISRCRECGLVYTSPRIKDPEGIYRGREELYFAEARLVFEGRAAHHRDPNYRFELRRIARHRAGGRLLDVGCNMGMLLRLARRDGWDAVGLEPSPSLAALARRWGAPIHNCLLHEVPEAERGSFDVVALSDVFEHIAAPLPFLDSARRVLKADGILYVKVPNVGWSLLKQRLLGFAGRRPRKGLWDSYEHVVHYSPGTLRQMLAKGGFEVLEMTIDPPVQTPNWHEYVGHYYQYPVPWALDARRQTVRMAFYRLAQMERVLRFGGIGPCAPNLVAVARVAGPAGSAR